MHEIYSFVLGRQSKRAVEVTSSHNITISSNAYIPVVVQDPKSVLARISSDDPERLTDDQVQAAHLFCITF
jgi:hypothetical protein